MKQYLAEVSDVEAWIAEKLQIVSSQDFGKDEDAAAKLLTKHRAVELELQTHDGLVKKLGKEADKLIKIDKQEGMEIHAKQVSIMSKNNLFSQNYGIFTVFSCSISIASTFVTLTCSPIPEVIH